VKRPRELERDVMLKFNTLLNEVGVDPANVRLLRHQPEVDGKSLFDVWRTDRAAFEAWQAIQPVGARAHFARPIWASFIGTWDGGTVFVGLYDNLARNEAGEPGVTPISNDDFEAGAVDHYTTQLSSSLDTYRGRLFIEWGGGSSGKRAWKQLADAQNKVITQLHREAAQAPFPGLLQLSEPLSRLATRPPSWVEQLSAAKGVYLLTCPNDGSLYVGSATGAGGFWARWSEYRANGHGGNVALRGRPFSDYTVSILQVAGSSENNDDVLAAEQLWKRKLMSRKFQLDLN
jgi:hypothetical protein